MRIGTPIAWLVRPAALLAFMGLFCLLPLALPASPMHKAVTLQLSWHHQYQFAGYYLAEILGYYEQEMLQVNILPGKPGIYPVDEVVDGRAHFGIGNAGLLVHHDQGKPVLALAAIIQHDPTVLIGLKSSGIKHIRDLSGKRVMLQPGYGSLSLQAMLQQTGLTNRIERLESSMDIDDLIQGHTDLFNGYTTNEPYLLEKRGIDHVIFNPYDYGIQFYNDILFTRQVFEEKDPETVAAFRRASLRGWRYAMENPEKSIRLITHFYHIDKDNSWLRYEANKLRELVIPDLVEIGHMNPLRWEKIAEQLSLIGLMSSEVDMENFIYQPNDSRIDWRILSPYILSAATLLVATAFGLLMMVRLNRNLREEVTTRRHAEYQATKLATHDSLTGLPNRILFMDRLEKSLKRARREKNTPGLIFFDLDNFKMINDNYGHHKGDEALKLVAKYVKQSIRESDTFARLSGDEFTLLIDDCDSLQFQALAEKILASIQEALQSLHTGIELGCSIGLLVIRNPSKDAEAILSQADHLMYRAKFNGKNQIESGEI